MPEKSNNIFIENIKDLIISEHFQDKLKQITSLGYSHFEKWLQIELACIYDEKNFEDHVRFQWHAELKIQGAKVIPDFTLEYTNGKIYYIEIKQNNSFLTCLRAMARDFNKIKDVVGTESYENINCIGIFKKSFFSDEKLEKFKNEFKKHKYLFIKLNKIQIEEIPNTQYSIMLI